MNGEYSLSDIASVTRNSDGLGGEGSWWIILFLIFGLFGWGGNRGGFGGGSGASDNYVLASDFATIQRQLSDGFGGVEKGLDTIRNGLCDGFYTEAQLVNGVNTNIMQGNNAIATQIADCCCKTQSGIKDVEYAIATNSAQTNYNMATQNCATLQAIDKVGDRIIDYMSQREAQALRDEVAQYREKANSQYIINEINKCPIPAYLTCNPNAPLNYSINYGNGCGCGIA